MDDRDERTTPARRPSARRKLLVATLGLATLSVMGCGGVTSGNLVAPPPEDAGTDAGTDTGTTEDAGEDR